MPSSQTADRPAPRRTGRARRGIAFRVGVLCALTLGLVLTAAGTATAAPAPQALAAGPAAQVPAATAPAAASDLGAGTNVASACPDNYFCVWESSPFGGKFAKFQTGSSDLRNFLGGVLDKRITDAWNRTNSNFCLWSGAGYSGSLFMAAPDFKGYLSWFNDQARSIRFC